MSKTGRNSLQDVIVAAVEYADSHPRTYTKVDKRTGKEVEKTTYGLSLTWSPGTDEESGDPFPSIKQIMDDAGLSERADRDAMLRRMEADGLVSLRIFRGAGMVLFTPDRAPQGSSRTPSDESKSAYLKAIGA